MEAYDEARSSIDELFAACRGIAKALSLKRAKTTVIDTMSKLMKQVPEFIKYWQECSARGVASLVLATFKAHFPTMNFADVARDTPKGANMRSILAETQGFDQLFVRRVNHSFWYHKYDLPKGFSTRKTKRKALRNTTRRAPGRALSNPREALMATPALVPATALATAPPM
jgi:hypothetical protein